MTEFQNEMTVKLYDENSYEKEFTACVRSCIQSGDFFKIELDRTAFFPEGGGQPGDSGTLKYFVGTEKRHSDVFDTQIKNGVITHYASKPIPEGTDVIGSIDFEKRFVRMQCHSAEHIVSGLVNSVMGFDNIGFHLTDEYVTCDYNGIMTWEDIKDLEKRANSVVFSNLEIKAAYPSAKELASMDFRSKLDFDEADFEKGLVRIVTIPGVDCCACCAPHVKRTGEIGLIKIINFEKSHGGTRLHLRAGITALRDYDEKQNQVLKIINLLSARQFEIADCVEQLQRSNSQLNYDLSEASKAIAAAKLDAIDGVVDGNLVVYMPGADTDTLRSLANGGKEKCDGIVVALTECDGGFRYIITTSDKDIKLKGLSKEYNASLSGRGGGKDDMISGVFSATLSEIEDYFNIGKV